MKSSEIPEQPEHTLKSPTISKIPKGTGVAREDKQTDRQTGFYFTDFSTFEHLQVSSTTPRENGKAIHLSHQRKYPLSFVTSDS